MPRDGFACPTWAVCRTCRLATIREKMPSCAVRHPGSTTHSTASLGGSRPVATDVPLLAAGPTNSAVSTPTVNPAHDRNAHAVRPAGSGLVRWRGHRVRRRVPMPPSGRRAATTRMSGSHGCCLIRHVPVRRGHERLPPVGIRGRARQAGRALPPRWASAWRVIIPVDAFATGPLGWWDTAGAPTGRAMGGGMRAPTAIRQRQAGQGGPGGQGSRMRSGWSVGRLVVGLNASRPKRSPRRSAGLPPTPIPRPRGCRGLAAGRSDRSPPRWGRGRGGWGGRMRWRCGSVRLGRLGLAGRSGRSPGWWGASSDGAPLGPPGRGAVGRPGRHGGRRECVAHGPGSGCWIETILRCRSYAPCPCLGVGVQLCVPRVSLRCFRALGSCRARRAAWILSSSLSHGVRAACGTPGTSATR